MDIEAKTTLWKTVDVDRLIALRLARLYVPGYTRDDLVQEGRLAAWTALDEYDPERGALSSYLTRSIKNAYLKLLAAATTQKRRPAFPVSSDVDCVPDVTPTVEQGAILEERAQTIRCAIANVRDGLRQLERDVVDCFMIPSPELLTTVRNLGRRRVSRSAVALYLGITPDRVQTIIKRVRNVLEPSIVDVYND